MSSQDTQIHCGGAYINNTEQGEWKRSWVFTIQEDGKRSSQIAICIIAVLTDLKTEALLQQLIGECLKVAIPADYTSQITKNFPKTNFPVPFLFFFLILGTASSTNSVSVNIA